MDVTDFGLERKFCQPESELVLKDGLVVEGYASLFGVPDRGGDIVEKGAYRGSLAARDRRVRMLWQHDPAEPIGVWDELREDGRGLYVRGRLLKDVGRAREAAALLEAGAIEGLSIGYRTLKAKKDDAGRRHLVELELWEVSLVTFPMLPDARVGAKGDDPADDLLREIVAAIEAARRGIAPGR